MKTLTPVSEFTDVSVPEDGVDRRTAASLETPFQALANRTKSLLDRRGAANGVASLNGSGKVPSSQLPRGEADGVASLDEDGYLVQDARTVLVYADIAAMRDTANVPDGTIARCVDLGLFVFKGSDTTSPDDGVNVLALTNPANGRWLRVDRSQRDVANGVVALDENKTVRVTASGDNSMAVIAKGKGRAGVRGESLEDSTGAYGPGGEFFANEKRGALNIAHFGGVDGADLPTAPLLGDVLFDTADQKLKVCTDEDPVTWTAVH